jgi:hypothetical protein
MDPVVTLVGEPWITRTMVFGKKKFAFNGGVPKNVSVAVALALKRRKDEQGKLLFKVEGIPQVIKAVHPPVKGIPIPVYKEVLVPRQRKLAECLL